MPPKRIKSTESKKPEKESHTPKHPNTEENEVSTPWFLLAQDPLAEFDQHMSVAYSMMDEYPLDDDTDDDNDEEQKNSQINAHLNKNLEQQSKYEEVDSKEFYEEFYKEFSLKAMDTIDDHFNQLQGISDRHGINLAINSEDFRNFVEYVGMLQKVLTLVQQLEDNDRKGEINN